MPRPNAKPLKFLEFRLQFSRTIGFTIPQPSISNHLPSFDKISTSADGSVNEFVINGGFISVSNNRVSILGEAQVVTN